MKLTEIKNKIEPTNLIEGVVPPHVILPMQQIIDDGKITNIVQAVIMTSLLKMLNFAGVEDEWPRELAGFQFITTADELDKVKVLPDAMAVGFAGWILDELSKYENNQDGVRHDFNHFSHLKHARHVSRKQD